MSEKHTPEPWIVNGDRWNHVVESADEVVADTANGASNVDEAYANARRIVACVNACKDWPTDVLEAWAADPSSPLLTNQLAAAERREAALRAEVEWLRKKLTFIGACGAGIRDCAEYMRPVHSVFEDIANQAELIRAECAALDQKEGA